LIRQASISQRGAISSLIVQKVSERGGLRNPNLPSADVNREETELISPIAAIAAAFILYGRHCDRVEPERRVPVIGYVLALIICGAIGGYFGLFFGIKQALLRSGGGQPLRLVGIFRHGADLVCAGTFDGRDGGLFN
jgi:hypothetical protein